MGNPAQTPTGKSPKAEGLRRTLHDDTTTGDLVAILGATLEDYVDAVVGYWGDPAREPQVRLVDTDLLKQQGHHLDVAKLEELTDWLAQVAAGSLPLRPLNGGGFPGAAIASTRRKARWITGGDMQTAAPVINAPPRGSIEVENSEIGRAVKDQVARATTMVRTQRTAMPPLPKGPPKSVAETATGAAGKSQPRSAAKSTAAPSTKPRPTNTQRPAPRGAEKYQDDPNARLKDRLTQLKEAYDSGLLTQAEYTRKKNELMKGFG